MVVDAAMASKLLFLRKLPRLLKPLPLPLSSSYSIRRLRLLPLEASRTGTNRWSPAARNFCSRPLNLADGSQGPAAIDYRSVLQEDEFHRLANSTIHNLLEKLEEYGDNVEIDGFDVDYGNEVLTLKLGDLGTYVLNKQTPNRQIWLSSPVSGPSRFDWDQNAQTWVYRRTKVDLLKIFESELEQLCGEPINLS
ncbi:frataxin, mitochondrial-like isoform X2 [Juglans microcarpa x Juglans regia]|uniref:frataxin, mitochondrial-like isoform X2 n=1 Tax=Juglans microcarpa x Juglans regia TaxID=2249226 RepID=UPI001B7E8066|nr:frataxin, mitochondrial-like isoform X2 [Juglans microcarpa x Juglans regia]